MVHALLSQAQRLGAELPPLLLEAERIAQTVHSGIHGRRRAGTGESFWQFRRYEPGDAADRIDWRQSSRTDKIFIREREYEAAQNAYLWADMSGSMHYSSTRDVPTKAERAQILMLALASLLLRGGEKVTWLAQNPITTTGRNGLERIVSRIATLNSPPLAEGVRGGGVKSGKLLQNSNSYSQSPSPLPHPPREGEGTLSLPPDIRLSQHGHMVLASDFLMPPEQLQKQMQIYTEHNQRGVLLHILDPLENNFNLQGRLELQGCENETHLLVPNASSLHAAYQARLQEHKERLQFLAQGAGWFYTSHITSEAPHLALLRITQLLEFIA